MSYEEPDSVTFEFSRSGKAVARARWIGPGSVELEVADPKLRGLFSEWLTRPTHHLTDLAEGEPSTHRDKAFDSPHLFVERCMTLGSLYRVRRTFSRKKPLDGSPE